MTKSKELAILKWYQTQDIDEIISNNTRDYLKNKVLITIPDSTMQNVHQNVLAEPPKLQTAKYLDPSSASMLARKIADGCSSLEELEKAVKNFDGCSLKRTATNTVFCDGVSSAEVMLIGEAPGANEDLRGIPFCGESGKLLDKILETIGFSRKENLYITNSIFWRPPGNRKPTDEEIRCCLPFVEKHIALVEPKLIILAGSVACYSLFGSAQSISKQRQKILKYQNQYLTSEIPVVVIFHPSYLLRQPSQKKLAWQDMLFIKDFIDRKAASYENSDKTN